MIDWIKTALKKPGYRYLLVGGTVYVLELIIIIVAQNLGASATLAVGLSFWLGTAISFGLQKVLTFGDKRIHHRILVPQMLAFAALIVCNFSFTVLITKLLEDVVPPVATRTLALGITTIWNFYLYKTKIFNRPDSN